MAPSVVVATDSSACLPREFAERWGIRVAPLQVIIDDVAREEGGEVTPAEVVAALTGGSRVGTSQPGPDAIARVLTDAASEGADAAVFLALSSRMSGTADAVAAAAASAPLRVEVVDSGTVALALGLAAASAAAVARSGGSAEDVVAEARRAARASLCLFTVDTLDYLRRGGRVSPAVAAIGNALGVKPVLGVLSGEVGQVDRVRTTAKARQAVLDRIASRARAYRHPVVGLMGLSGDDELVAESTRQLHTRGDWPVVTGPLSAALAAHAGPGALAAVVVDVHPDVAASVVAGA